MQPTRNGEGATAIGMGGPPGIPVRPLWQLAEPVVMPRGSPLQVGQYAAAKSDGTKSGSREGSGSGMGPFALLCFPFLACLLANQSSTSPSPLPSPVASRRPQLLLSSRPTHHDHSCRKVANWNGSFRHAKSVYALGLSKF